MFRLYKAELKKIFLKPSIFVVTGLLILMLALSTFLYNPNTRDNSKNYVNYPSKYGRVSEIYNEFDTGTTYSFDKKQLSKTLDDAKVYINFYYNEENIVIDGLSDRLEKINQKENDYESAHSRWSQRYEIYLKDKSDANKATVDGLKDELVQRRNDFEQALKNFSNYYSDNIVSAGDKVRVLSTKTINKNIVDNVNTCLGYIEKFPNTVTEDPDGAIIAQLEADGYYANLKSNLSKLIPFEPDKELVGSLYSYVDTANERLVTYYDKIQTFANENSSSVNSVDLKKIKNLITDYALTVTNAYNVVVNSIKLSGLSKYSATAINKYYGFENANFYEMNEKLAKVKYLFDHDDFDYNYADTFSIIQPSNQEINGFDYSYYALRLCTLFITIYIVVLAASTIAGEQSAGTLKLLAIRPYTRNKLLTCKILATLSIGGILLLVSSVATLVVGGINYGFASAPILYVFNSTKAGVMSPVFMYLLALISMFIEVSFYALLSVCISTVFKSNIGAVSVSTLIYFISLVLNVVAVNVPLLGYLPFANISFFKYFGSSFVTYSNANGLLQGILTPTVYTGGSFWISFVIFAVSTGLITYITYLLFKRRDIK